MQRLLSNFVKILGLGLALGAFVDDRPAMILGIVLIIVGILADPVNDDITE